MNDLLLKSNGRLFASDVDAVNEAASIAGVPTRVEKTMGSLFKSALYNHTTLLAKTFGGIYATAFTPSVDDN